MSLSPGTRLGPYEVVSALGRGGMGEVYRAKDTRLGRTVAVKVLVGADWASADRRHRFERESRAASALNHPNVVVVHDVGEHEGAPYLVTELLEGSTLRAQLAAGPVPIARAVAFAIDVAHGLAAAHDRGIVHRDIKPENLFVTRDGRVKILDFGVAAVTDGGDGEPLETATWQATEPGVALGTIGYMSPEQVRGVRVDARSDVFALGVVLHELLGGANPFARASKAESLAAILGDVPPSLDTVRGDVPRALARIVEHCLEKDAAVRYQSARDLAFALEALVDSPGSGVPRPSPPRRRRRWLALAAGAPVLVALAMIARGLDQRPREALPPRYTFEIAAPADGMLQGILGISSAVSPDGTKVALAVTTPVGHQLFLRPLDSTAARPVEGGEGGFNPFWSPDGQWLAFFTPNKLKRVHVGGGPAQTIADLGTSWGTMGAWGRGDTILVSGALRRAGSADPGPLVRISASGGQPAPVLRESQGAPLGWPAMLPDGRRFLFLAWGQHGPEVRAGSLDSGETSLVMRAFSRAVYAPPGYLLFVRDSTLMAQRFDPATLSLSGVPHAVADGLLYFRQLGIADFSASDNGVLVFQAGDTASRLVWYARDGTEQRQIGPTADYFFMRLSPSGRHVAVDRMDRRLGTTDLALLDVGRGGPPVAITSDEFVDWAPVFSPDERQVAFASARRGAPHVHLKGLHDSTNGTELLPPTASVQFVTDWATGPGGPFIVYNDERPETHGDIFLAPLGGTRSPRPLVQTVADEADGRVSPDGQWLAYVSTESGRSEVYVRALRDATERYQVSAGGGMSPRWRRDGTELYYIAAVSPAPFGPAAVPGMLTAVQVHASGRTLRAGMPRPLFAVRARQGQYEPSPDGSRFLVNSGSGIGALPITVVTDWSRDLPR